MRPRRIDVDLLPDFAVRLVLVRDAILVLIFSAGIGWEREARNRAAGLRTHILVGLAAWLLVAAGEVVARRHSGSAGMPDPLRMVEAVVTGVAVVGAGTIVFADETNRVRGVTTAASLLVTAAPRAARRVATAVRCAPRPARPDHELHAR